jgi:hypothetical protein
MAQFNITLNVPDEKVDELKQMIDDRLGKEYGKKRVSTDEEGNQVINYNYQEWIKFLVESMLKAHYFGWKKEKLQEQNENTIETETNNLIS